MSFRPSAARGEICLAYFSANRYLDSALRASLDMTSLGVVALRASLDMTSLGQWHSVLRSI
ncbi:MAG: hypothetical protein ACI399_00550 [Candidatus Cryptobacteroides sp.]